MCPSDGTYGCGRVIQVAPKGTAMGRVMFLAALFDWHSTSLPTAESIAGAACLRQGRTHLKAITEVGGVILGFRPLEHDGIEPWLFRGAHGWQNSNVMRGLEIVRPQTSADKHMPVISAWGYKVIQIAAESRFIESKE
jgi:hypothetical protein